jgi:hypothetical protein
VRITTSRSAAPPHRRRVSTSGTNGQGRCQRGGEPSVRASERAACVPSVLRASERAACVPSVPSVRVPSVRGCRAGGRARPAGVPSVLRASDVRCVPSVRCVPCVPCVRAGRAGGRCVLRAVRPACVGVLRAWASCVRGRPACVSGRAFESSGHAVQPLDPDTAASDRGRSGVG